MAWINYLYCPLVVIGEIWSYLCILYFSGWEKVSLFFRKNCCCCNNQQPDEILEAGVALAPMASSGASKTDRADASEGELQPFLAAQDQVEDHGTCCESEI
ncbi:hypothetical protein GCK72_023306 [Caenorhabditis remanei]|uniref:Uncharacterized protein n=1 Tax=Caenorhabditis remanei TaxID=31234 RepID=A0A6A5FW41_CAERE|nr:hypothetical protein GCK72_023306 [Caenorhabditis remanei]KAF1746848.1 hypothetical protein GCK72_023306 [Caenorhabditis remanei]